jgi:hypothetical protein
MAPLLPLVWLLGLSVWVTPMKDSDGQWRVSGYYVK